MTSRRALSSMLIGLLLFVSSAGGVLAQDAGPDDQTPAAPAAPVGPGFSYNGRLFSGGAGVTGSCDFQFGLWDDAVAGGQLGVTQTVSSLAINAGLFTATLNAFAEFGNSAFDGNARFLAIALRCPTAVGSFTPLSPRQALLATPYALYAVNAGSASVALSAFSADHAPWAGLSGVPAGFADGVDDVGGGAAAWQLTGNGGTTASNFVGTTNNMTLTLAVSGTAALRLVPNATSPNVLGGHISNTVSAGVVGATIGGGGVKSVPNSVTASYGTVGGGFSNTATGYASTVGGGGDNTADDYAVVGGGNQNTASGTVATVGGGGVNTASGGLSTVSGGGRNTASGDNAVVGGGDNNTASGAFATVGGGKYNTASGPGATVGGGGFDLLNNGGNQALGAASTIGGGLSNASYSYATVGGGQFNTAGGSHATVGGGQSNIASGAFATVGGGRYNNANGNYSFAAGRNAQAVHTGTFVWSSSETTPISSTASNQFLVRATGGISLSTNVAGTTGCRLSSGGGTWNCTSDRNAKANFAPVDGEAVLETLMGIPIETWNFNTQDAGIRHIGPMAQDFNAAFRVGESETQISAVDADGVALAAIQGLYSVVQKKDEELLALRASNAELQAAQTEVNARLAALETGAAPAPSAAALPWLLLAALGLLNLGGLAGYTLARVKRQPVGRTDYASIIAGGQFDRGD